MDLDITNPTNVGMETPQNIFENLFAGLWENLVRSVQETFLSRFCSNILSLDNTGSEGEADI